MNSQRCSTSTPGVEVSTMNALIDHPAAAVGERRRGGAHARRVRAHVVLGERERGDRALGEPRQPLLLLLLGAEHLERLRHADRLVRRQQRHHRAAVRADERHRVAVRVLGEPEPAVLARNLDPERAQVAQPLDHVGGDPGVALDLVRVHLLAQESLEPAEELAPALLLFRIRLRVRVQEPQLQASQEQLANERGSGPRGLARSLGHGAGFLLGGVGDGRDGRLAHEVGLDVLDPKRILTG
jgi:hypothetical protein